MEKMRLNADSDFEGVKYNHAKHSSARADIAQGFSGELLY